MHLSDKDIANKYNSIFDELADYKQDLLRHGFTVMPLLDTDDLKKLNADAAKLVSSSAELLEGGEFLSAGRIEEADIREFSTTSIQQHARPKLARILDPEIYELVSGIHLIKPPGKHSALNPHQDSSLVDETEFSSVYVWIPLADVTAENGTLHVLPGSHRLGITQRSLQVDWPLLKFEKSLWKHMKALDVKAGDAVIFDSALIHSSAPNQSDEIRLAINFFVRPKRAAYMHFYRDKLTPKNKVEVYNVTPEFYYSHDIMQRPAIKFPLIGYRPLSNPTFKKAELMKWVNEMGKQYETSNS